MTKKHYNDEEWLLIRECFTYNNGKYRGVKNLGWLLRNWKIITLIQIDKEIVPSLRHKYECRMICYFDGGFYQTYWASKTNCREWLARPVFKGLKLLWFKEYTVC